MKLDIVFCGVGGQGVVVLSDVFCEAAMQEGFDVAKAEVHGMAQRGGSIVAYARIGDKVETPLIEAGQADVVVGFEVLETARNLPMLSKSGSVVVNTKHIPPNYIVTCTSPVNPQDLLQIINGKAKFVYQVDGEGIAESLGNPLVVNTVLLGALSALPEITVSIEAFENAMASRLKQKYFKLRNLEAFKLGRESVLKNQV
jgi:indolepyruvate ferredoxin oxidoreductase beta subunit